MFVIPNHLSDEINERLDAEFEKHPCAEKDREALFSQLIEYVNEHGVMPEFSLKRNAK